VAPAPVAVSDEKMRKVTGATISEFLGVGDFNEAMLCIKELNSPSMHPVFVEEAVTIVVEKKQKDRSSVGLLLNRMVRDRQLDVGHLCKGLGVVVEMAPDFAVDIPHMYKYLAEVIGPLVHDGAVPLTKIAETLRPLNAVNKAGVVMAESLCAAAQIKNEEDIAVLWSKSGLTWDKLLPSGEDVDMFVKDRKVGFTIKSQQTTTTTNTTSNNGHPSTTTTTTTGGLNNKLYDDMVRILTQNTSNTNDELMSLVDRNVRPEERKSDTFIQTLTTAVCFTSVSRDASNANNCECRKDVVRSRARILLKYIDNNKKLELQALFALQQLLEELKHPRGVLNTLFEELYQADIISDDTFFEWEQTKQCPVGKGPALSSAKNFLSWLRKAEEESNDEESAAM
jgi:translation initiation factor 4G